MGYAGAAAALFAAGGVAGAVGSEQAAQGQAALAGSNEAYARFRAKDALAVGALQVGDYQRQIAQLLGEQKVAFLSQGGLPDEGTPAEVIAGTARTANVDEQRLILNALRERYGALVQANDFSQEAKNAHAAGTAGAIGSLFGAAGSALGVYAK